MLASFAHLTLAVLLKLLTDWLEVRLGELGEESRAEGIAPADAVERIDGADAGEEGITPADAATVGIEGALERFLLPLETRKRSGEEAVVCKAGGVEPRCDMKKNREDDRWKKKKRKKSGVASE